MPPASTAAAPPSSSRRCRDFPCSDVPAATPPSGCPFGLPPPSGSSCPSDRLRGPPSALPRSEAWPLRESQASRSPSRSALHRLHRRLIRPLLTSRPAANAASPFQARGETFPGKTADLLRTTAGFTLTGCGRKSFAVACPLALPCTPPIRFLFVSPRIRSTLLSAPTSRSTPCASLGSPRPGLRRTPTFKPAVMLGTHARRQRAGPRNGGYDLGAE